MCLRVWIIVVCLPSPAELTCTADRVVREERDLRARVHDVGIRRSIRGPMERYARFHISNGGRVHVHSPLWPLYRFLLQCAASRSLAPMSDTLIHLGWSIPSCRSLTRRTMPCVFDSIRPAGKRHGTGSFDGGANGIQYTGEWRDDQPVGTYKRQLDIRLSVARVWGGTE